MFVCVLSVDAMLKSLRKSGLTLQTDEAVSPEQQHVNLTKVYPTET